MSTRFFDAALAATRVVRIPARGASLAGELAVPRDARGLVVFCRTNADVSARKGDRGVAETMRDHRYATLLFDLLTPDEEIIDATTRHLRGDLPLLARRLIDTLDWLTLQPGVARLPIALFGDGYGAAAALVAACARPLRVRAIISRDGRTDRATAVLRRVSVPILLLADGNDAQAVQLNEKTFGQLRTPKELVLLDGTETPVGPVPSEIARLAVGWLDRHLTRREMEALLEIC